MTSHLPLVSIGVAVWNGQAYLETALQSLLDQDYKNLEIIILDNQSTDRTAAICQSLAARDARIHYILDSQERDVMSAQIKVAHLAKGDFYMVACDDDWYDPYYVSSLLNILVNHPEVGLAYSGMGLIDSEGYKSAAPPIDFLSRTNTPSDNLRGYLAKRDPAPIVFGLVRTHLHLDALKYYKRPDDRGWNHDNLYLMRLMSQARIEGVKNVLFYYRQQDRRALYEKRRQYYQPANPLLRYVNHILHQWSVKKAAEKIIDDSSFSPSIKRNLKYSNFCAFLSYIQFKYLREFIKDSASNWRS